MLTRQAWYFLSARYTLLQIAGNFKVFVRVPFKAYIQDVFCVENTETAKVGLNPAKIPELLVSDSGSGMFLLTL